MSLRVGLHALGIGTGSDPEVVAALARAAEDHGFAMLWAGEHVVMVDHSRSDYPYADDGTIPVASDADWLDPMLTLSFAAAATSTIGLATGILLLPEHNPVVVAKQAATLDRLSGGRFRLGVGFGWSREEFAALGVPFTRRRERTQAYVAAMRTIWTDDPSTFASEFTSFEAIRVHPKPKRRSVPVVLGGSSDRALHAVAAWADGWYGFALDGVDEVADRMKRLHRWCNELARDPGELYVAVALRDPRPDDCDALRRLGVAELVLVETPPRDPHTTTAWVAGLADRWLS